MGFKTENEKLREKRSSRSLKTKEEENIVFRVYNLGIIGVISSCSLLSPFEERWNGLYRGAKSTGR